MKLGRKKGKRKDQSGKREVELLALQRKGMATVWEEGGRREKRKKRKKEERQKKEGCSEDFHLNFSKKNNKSSRRK